MKAAGLTHGGFYGYFESKDALIAAALAEALAISTGPSGELAAHVARYLSRTHRDDLARGCPTAALAAETIRPPAARAPR
jgi:TetR/AcrR family transcriptional repressor of nem operon